MSPQNTQSLLCSRHDCKQWPIHRKWTDSHAIDCFTNGTIPASIISLWTPVLCKCHCLTVKLCKHLLIVPYTDNSKTQLTCSSAQGDLTSGNLITYTLNSSGRLISWNLAVKFLYGETSLMVSQHWQIGTCNGLMSSGNRPLRYLSQS